MTQQTTTPHSELIAVNRRNAFVDRLRTQAVVHTPEVEDALRTVPRHPFAPDLPLEDAYAAPLPHAAVSRIAAEPALAALLLEQAQVRPGMRVLLAGPTTGYLAALLAHLTGVHGQVTSVNPGSAMVRDSVSHLTETGYHGVHVINSPAALGHADGGPYDRLIATEEVGEVPAPWLQQVTPEGRVIVPLRLRGSVYRIVSFARTNDHWTASYQETDAFLPPLYSGLVSDPLRLAALDDACTTILHLHQEQPVNGADLFGVLDQERHEVWTQVPMTAQDNFDALHLFLACSLAGGLSRMTVSKEAAGKVAPAFPWGTMAVASENDLAYITLRDTDTSTAGGEPEREIGIIGHGPDGESLAQGLAYYIGLWHWEFRNGTVRINLQRADAPARIDGQYAYDGPSTRLVIDWL